MNILITAFGPFNKFSINPSEIVLKMLKEHINSHHFINLEWEVLDVSYNEIDKFIQNNSLIWIVNQIITHYFINRQID